MSKVSNSNNQFEKVNKTNKPMLTKLQPILIKGIGGVIMASFSLLVTYQLPRIVITISTDVCQSHQNSNLIKVDFSAKEFTDLEK